ncbi:MAG TPA: hypothetical protein VFY00_01500, partial [Arenimonas sp.]|nr:hypothetical protein [Arenimonas sp.]
MEPRNAMTMQTKTLFLSACLLAMAGCATVRVTEAPRPSGPVATTGIPDAPATPADDGRWHFDD